MKRRLKRTIQITIGLAILVLLFMRVGIVQFWDTLKTINPLWLIPSFLMTFVVQTLATINIKILLKALNKNVSFGYLWKAVTLSQSLGTVAPGRMGEFSLILFLKNKNVGYGTGLVIAVLDKIITFVIVSIIALIGILWFFNLKLFLVVLAACISIVFILIYAILSNKIRDLIKKYILSGYSKYFKGFSKDFQYIMNEKKKYLLLNFIVTIIKWVTSFLSLWFIFKAFNQPISGHYIIFVSAVVIIISLIPISFSGLGLREGSGTYLYRILTGISTALIMNVMIIATIRKYIIAFFFYLINLDLLEVKKLKKI